MRIQASSVLQVHPALGPTLVSFFPELPICSWRTMAHLQAPLPGWQCTQLRPGELAGTDRPCGQVSAKENMGKFNKKPPCDRAG